MNNTLVTEAQAIKEEIIGWRRDLHQIPELGTTLPQTMAYISARLTEMGIEHEVKEDISCIFATIGTGDKCFLLRGDVDGLPGEEKSGLEFASTNGCMHSCGHDMHGAALLGAAKILKAHENELNGTVRLLFQSGEEVFAGAKAAIEAGVLEGVDAAFGLHIFASESLGSMSYNDILMGAVYGFKITLTGVGGHGSQPERCIDPINAGVEVYHALQALIARECPALENAALTIGQFSAGSAANVIPETAVLQGTLRTFDKATRELLIRRINEIVPAVGAAYRCKVDIEVLSSVPSLACEKSVLDSCVNSVKELGIMHTFREGAKYIGSEDFALIAEKVPSCYFVLGAGVEDESQWYGQHNPKIIFNEDSLSMASAIHAKVAMEWLNK